MKILPSRLALALLALTATSAVLAADNLATVNGTAIPQARADVIIAEQRGQGRGVGVAEADHGRAQRFAGVQRRMAGHEHVAGLDNVRRQQAQHGPRDAGAEPAREAVDRAQLEGLGEGEVVGAGEGQAVGHAWARR